jgi:hypothetical protein
VQALTEVARITGVPRSEIAFAGLKDRQGVTEQWISVRRKRLDVRRSDLQVTFVGRAKKPITSKQSSGNAFEIVLRELEEQDVERLRARLLDGARGRLPQLLRRPALRLRDPRPGLRAARRAHRRLRDGPQAIDRRAVAEGDHRRRQAEAHPARQVGRLGDVRFDRARPGVQAAVRDPRGHRRLRRRRSRRCRRAPS